MGEPMRVLQRIKHDLKTGWAGLRYGTAQAAHRAMAETEMLQLRLDVRKLEERLNDLCRDLGERALKLYERGVTADQIMADFEIIRAAEQAKELTQQRTKLLAEMQELRTPT